MRRKTLWEEEEAWRVKRAISRVKTTRRSPHLFKINSSKKSSASLMQSKLFNKFSTEVVIKITSNSKNLKTLKQHLDYISRNGNVELISKDGLIYSGKEEVREARDIFRDEGGTIPKKTEIGQREYRETYNMVFSFRQTDKDILLDAANKTISSMYPNNYFVLAFHGDTDHSHCHICLKVKDSSGKRLDIKKSNLENLRKDFAQNLRDLGILATATKHKKPKHDIIQKDNDQHYYEIIGYGKAPYEHKEGNEVTGYVKYLTSKGEERIIYGKDIERAARESKVNIGERAKLKLTGKEEVTVKIKDKNRVTGEINEIYKTVTKNRRECITLEQAKKDKQQNNSQVKPITADIQKTKIKEIETIKEPIENKTIKKEDIKR